MHLQVNRRQFTMGLAATALAFPSLSTEAFGAEIEFDKAATKNVVQANNAFAFTLLHGFSSAHPTDDQFFSPFSIESALTIAMEGARGRTATQMGMALQYPASLKFDERWDLQTLRNEYLTILDSLLPSTHEAASSNQQKLLDLMKAKEALDAQATQLSKENKLDEWNKTFVQSRRLAKRIAELKEIKERFELAIANSLWVDRSFPLSQPFQQTIQKFYGSSEVNACDFNSAPDKERSRINGWVANKTRGKIQELLSDQSVTTDTRLVIANAVYFKGQWVKSFKESDTAPAEFTTADGRKTEVKMMSSYGLDVGRYAAFQGDGSEFKTPKSMGIFLSTARYPDEQGFQALELPYRGQRLSMVLLLPRRSDNLNKLVETMSAEKFAACLAAMTKRSVHVKLPRFKMETSYDLIPELRSLGMQDAFSSQHADFSGLVESKSSNERLTITTVAHQAFVEVNEKGTEAAAATGVVSNLISARPEVPFIPEFTADHPFLAAIIDNQSGMILFLGKVEAP